MDAQLLLNPQCELGENPMWDARENCLYWTDIDAGQVYRYVPGGAHEVIYSGDKVGGFTLQEDGSLLLFRVKDIARLEPRSRDLRVVKEVNEPGLKRFNDVIADPLGCVFAGTIGETDESGGLYRLERDGSFRKLWDGLEIANGMAFSMDNSLFYWTDSTHKSLYRFRYDTSSGELSERTLLYEEEDDSTPDGLTIDTDGNLYSARWDGSRIVKHAPDGEVLGTFSFPVPKVTSMIFYGADLDALFATTAGGGEEDAKEEEGALFKVEPGAKGREEFRSRILL